MMTKIISGLIGTFCVSLAYGQEFAYKSEVAPVTDTAYYRITLSPDLLGQLRPDQSDLRLYSDDGQEQPYLLRQEREMLSTSLFKEYEIIKKEYKKNAISYLIFDNPGKQAIDNVSLLVNNTDVQKRARLSGSDDQENWYVIKDNYLLHSMASEEETTELKILNFPLSDYAYFKLEINDNWKLPINILKVGYYDTQKEKGLMTSFEDIGVDQKDSLKTSYVKLNLTKLIYLEKLHFEVSGAEYYSRQARVMVKRERLNRKKKKEIFYETLASFDLNSNSENEVTLGGRALQEIYIEIENKDNQPLVVEKVRSSYLNKYMVAKLLPSLSYRIMFGDEELRSPDYDMAAFADQIPKDAVKIVHQQIIPLFAAEEIEEEPSLFDNVYLVWSVIGLVGIFLAVISVKMIKEIGQKEGKDLG